MSAIETILDLACFGYWEKSGMKLPNVRNASLPAVKIKEYLLSPQHPDGRSKAQFFMRFGFESKNWQQLADALRRHALENEVVSQQRTR